MFPSPPPNAWPVACPALPCAALLCRAARMWTLTDTAWRFPVVSDASRPGLAGAGCGARAPGWPRAVGRPGLGACPRVHCSLVCVPACRRACATCIAHALSGGAEQPQSLSATYHGLPAAHTCSPHSFYYFHIFVNASIMKGGRARLWRRAWRSDEGIKGWRGVLALQILLSCASKQ